MHLLRLVQDPVAVPGPGFRSAITINFAGFIAERIKKKKKFSGRARYIDQWGKLATAYYMMAKCVCYVKLNSTVGQNNNRTIMSPVKAVFRRLCTCCLFTAYLSKKYLFSTQLSDQTNKELSVFVDSIR